MAIAQDQLTPVQQLFERIEPGARRAHKRHILDRALTCFDAYGLQATTIEIIRRDADSSTGSIYHHFGSKEGLIAALFLIALDDQSVLIESRIADATQIEPAVDAVVRSYMEWVAAQPTLARFMFGARTAVATGAYRDKLAARNKARFGRMQAVLAAGVAAGTVRELPRETYASLLIGPAENYCRAWLSGRVAGSPATHALVFAAAAWRAIAARG